MVRRAAAIAVLVAVPLVVLAQPVVPGCPNPAATCSRSNAATSYIGFLDAGAAAFHGGVSIAGLENVIFVDAGVVQTHGASSGNSGTQPTLLGSRGTNDSALWLGPSAGNASGSNYSVAADSTNTYVSSPGAGGLYFGIANTFKANWTGSVLNVEGQVAASGVDAGQLQVGGGGAITKLIPCPRIDWDFAGIIPRPGFVQVTDKATCTGATPGDPCFVGVTKATPEDGGSAWEDNVRFDGIAVGVNQVQVRLSTLSGDGGAMNPPDAGYLVTCISNR